MIYREDPLATINLNGKGSAVEERVAQAKALLDEATRLDESGTKYILLICPKGSMLNP